MRKGRSTGSRIKAELAALAALPDAAINTADMPEVRDWRGATRGRFYRPVKKVITIRLDADVIAWFKGRDGRYQAAVNRALREYMVGHARQRKRNRPVAAARTNRRAVRA